ncbi:MAG: leucyl aminopeptidase [Acidiferrobacterales bacterium]
MEFIAKSGSPEKQRSACIVVGVFDSRKLSARARQIDQACAGMISSILRRGDLEGKLGQTLLLHNVPNMPCERVLLVGCGKEREFNERHYRETNVKAARLLNDTGSTEMTTYLTELEIKGRNIAWKVRQAVLAVEDALYCFDQLKSNPGNPRRPLRKVVLAVPKRSDIAAAEQAIKEGKAIGAGVALTKNLGNLPGNICTPSYLADQATELGNQFGVKTTVLEQTDIEKLGMGALLSVARGSRQPPKFTIIEYQGGEASEPPIALVGKGITFDSGGISIKPAAHMDEMKFDMCGAASALGTFKAVAELRLPINLVVIAPSAENMPGDDANKPGDIVTSMSGQTVEVLNTDAEGRLILCDALTYAERFKPAAVIDVATLTGACVIALGGQATGLLSNHEPLARELLNAGKESHDRAWQLPLWDEYQKQLDTNFADVANVGGRAAGTITAACFLSRFAKKFKWAHLDIAGTAWNSGKEKGATGRPVPLLTQFLINRSRDRSPIQAATT